MAGKAVDVYVKLSNGRAVQYDVHPNKKIGDVIDLVAKDEGVASNQVRLKYQGKHLVSNKTVQEYGVRAETILKSEVLVPKSLALVLNLPDGNTEEMTISNLETAAKLMSEICDKSGINVSQLEVECKGQVLTSSSSKLLDLGIENCAEINVKINEKKTVPEPVKRGGAAEADFMDEHEKESVLTSFQTHGKQVEVVFSFDTTGSMYQYLEQVRTKLKECCTRLIQDIPNIRIGLIAHGDYCDQESSYVIKCLDLTTDVDALVNFAWDVPKTQGGDSPECYEWVLRKAQHLDWAEESAKALVVIGDLFPHPPSYTDQEIEWREELNLLKGMGVKVYGIQAGNNNASESFYSELADVTEGRHLKLSHFDVITDMFLAVCYREGSDDLLEEFQQELEGAGRMSEQTRAMFEELKETDGDRKKRMEEKEAAASSSSSSKSKKYVMAEWWDHTLRHKETKPLYSYDAQTDMWKPEDKPDVTPSGGVFLRRNNSPPKRKRRRRCSIM